MASKPLFVVQSAVDAGASASDASPLPVTTADAVHRAATSSATDCVSHDSVDNLQVKKARTQPRQAVLGEDGSCTQHAQERGLAALGPHKKKLKSNGGKRNKTTKKRKAT